MSTSTARPVAATESRNFSASSWMGIGSCAWERISNDRNWENDRSVSISVSSPASCAAQWIWPKKASSASSTAAECGVGTQKIVARTQLLRGRV